MAFRAEVWERAKILITVGYTQSETVDILGMEYKLNDYQQEVLPAMVRHVDRHFGGKDDNSNRSQTRSDDRRE